MRLMLAIALAAFALAPARPAAPNALAQACGRGFIDITVVDAEGRSVPRAAIELVAEVPESYYALLRLPLPEGAVVLAPEWHALKVSPREAAEMIERGKPMSTREDVCGNPVKQVARSVKLKRPRPLEEGFSKKDFGFCTRETYQDLSLLKVSAPGYVTDYYLGPHLGGCWRTYRIVLAKAERGHKKSEP